MNLAQDENNKIFEVISEIKEKLLKIYNSDIVRPKDKNMVLKKYSAFDELGKSAYKYFKLKDNDLYDDAQKEFDNVSNLVLKGGISNTVFIWHSEFGEHTCNDCASLDGTQYTLEDDIPDSPHPNCKCYIEIVEFDGEEDGKGDGNGENTIENRPKKNKNDEPCDCLYDLPNEFDELVQEALNLQQDVKDMLASLFDQIKTKAGKLYESFCQKIIDEASHWDNAAGDFARNYNDMRDANTINADKYFHSKANCEATQRGGAGEEIAKAISFLREIEEGTRKVIFEGENVIEQIKDANRDMDANKFGREQAKLYPGDACKILIDVLRPNGLPEEY